MRLVNLTPHALTVMPEGAAAPYVIPASGQVARVTSTATPAGEVVMDGDFRVPVVTTAYGPVEGLPEPESDTVYIVSALVLAALAGSRPDVVAPDTGPQSVIRDSEGKILGVRRFTR